MSRNTLYGRRCKPGTKFKNWFRTPVKTYPMWFAIRTKRKEGIEFMSDSVSNMMRKQHPTRMVIYNRNLRSFDSSDASGNGIGERCENPRRGRQKSGSKRSSVGARMYKGSNDFGPAAEEAKSSDSRTKNSVSFGLPVPDDILDDLCFRFLINIPDDQKNTPVRLCFQIELAHWFYIDFYCKGNDANVRCPEVSLRDLVGQIFNHCDFLVQYTDSVDKVMEEWRIYKSGVPTYGAALLDSSLNYVLLVQGYFAKNSWGFPKGKVNEEEEAMACASREVMEEVGFDISDKICKTRLIQCFVNDTLIRLYIIRDVPIDFPFAPNTRNEIGKIQWFCIWDLPKDRNDVVACERIGMPPSNFYTVIPFVKDLQAYVCKYHNTHNKPRHKPMDAVNISTRSSSAFSPVQPQQKNEMLAPALSPLFTNTKTAANLNRSTVSQHSSQHASPNSAFFKPLTTSAQHISYTGTAFVQMVSDASCTSIEERVRMKEVTRPVPTVPKAALPVLGRPVYDAFRDETEKKVVTSFPESSNKTCLGNVLYHGVIDKKEVMSFPTDTLKKKIIVDCDNYSNVPVKKDIFPLSCNPGKDIETNYSKELNDCLKGHKILMKTASQMTEDMPFVNLCKAWKSFKFDVSRLF
ncbi:m7GpppN-mRNA hydrolase [Dirofilaria immitis]